MATRRTNRNRRNSVPVTRRIATWAVRAGVLMALVLVVLGFVVPKVKATASTVGTGFFGLFDKKSESEPELDSGQEALLSMSTSTPTPTPTPKPTATPKPEKSSKKGKKAEEAESNKGDDLTMIVANSQWDENGRATDAELKAQEQSWQTMAFAEVDPEALATYKSSYETLSASGLSDKEMSKKQKQLTAKYELVIANAYEDQVKNNALYTCEALRDVDNIYTRAFLYGFERYDDAMSAVAQASGAAVFNDSVSIPLTQNPEDDSNLFLWEIAQRIARDPLYADMWCQTFDELYMYDFNVESDKWELVSVGRVVNPLIHSFASDNKEEMTKYKKGEGQGAWYQLRLRGYGDEIVVEPDSFKQMCLFGMLAKSLTYLGTTTESPAVYWANNRPGVPDAKRRAAKRTDGNPETEPWAKLGFVRKESSPVGAGLVEYEVWVNLRDGRTGIPGEPTVPNTAPPVPVRPENPYVPKPTPVPTTPPQGGPNPSVTPVPQVTATPIPTTPPQGGPNPSVTPVPQVTATPVPTTPPQNTPTPVPLKDPTQIIPDDHPNRIDSDGYDNPDETEDEEEDYVSPSDHTEGYTDSDGDEVGPSSEWNQGQPDDSWSYVYVEPTQAPVTHQREEETDSEDDYKTDNDGSSSSSYEHYYEDEDGYWDAAPGTYTDPEDCNDNGSTADEEEQAIDDTEGYTYQPQTQSDITSPGGWHDQQEDTSLDGDSSSDGYFDYDF